MGLFGSLFDFNRDGTTDFSENALGMIAALAGAAEEEEKRSGDSMRKEAPYRLRGRPLND